MTRRRKLWRDERGVSLVLVLVTLVIFGLIVPVLGQFGSVNGVSGYVLKGNRFDRYAAEAGMQGAIQWAQATAQRQAGRQGTKCPAISTANLNGNDGPNASRSVTVRCAGFNDNGLPQATATIPQYALLALGTNAAITLDGGGKLQTSGAWWSNGSINPGNVAVDAGADYIGAHDGCSGITASPCDPATGGHVADPDLPIDVPTVIPVDRPIGTDRCEGVNGGQMTLRWGLHWDSDRLDWIGDGHCGDVTIHLAPGGPHIFDFQFFGVGRPDWKLVPQDRNATVRLVSDGWAPTGCTSGAGPVLFAGTFWMRLGDGATADLCGADASARSDQVVSVAQVMHGTVPHSETSPPSAPSRWTAGDGPRSLDGFPQSPPNVPPSVLAGTECLPDRGGCDTGTVQGRLHGDRAQGTVTMTVPDPVPAGVGAKVTNLHLAIVHQETGNDVDQRHVWISDGLPDRFAQVRCDLTNSGNDLGNSGESWRRDEYDCGMGGVQRPYFPDGDLTVTYQVQLDRQRSQQPEPSSTIGLDSVQLTATFQRPTAQTSHPSGNVLEVDSGGAMHTDGTLDLPGGDVQFDFGGAASSTFGRGLIVRTLDASNFPNDPAFTPFSLPNGGNYTDRLATFQAFLGSDTQPILTARVQFCDPHPDGTVDPNVSDKCKADGIAGGPAKILAWDPKR